MTLIIFLQDLSMIQFPDGLPPLQKWLKEKMMIIVWTGEMPLPAFCFVPFTVVSVSKMLYQMVLYFVSAKF